MFVCFCPGGTYAAVVWLTFAGTSVILAGTTRAQFHLAGWKLCCIALYCTVKFCERHVLIL